MVKLKNSEVLVVDNALAYLSQQSTPAWYGVSKNIRIISPFLKEIEASKKDIIDRYGEKDKEGNLVIDEETNSPKFKDQEEVDKIWSGLMNEEVEIDFYKIKVDTLKDSNLNAGLMSRLVDVILEE